MTWENVFFPDGRLRPIWRCFLSVGLMFFAYTVVSVTLGEVFRVASERSPFFTPFFMESLFLLILLLGVCKLLTAVFEGRPLGSVGLAFHKRWRKELWQGLGLGAAMILIVAALEWTLGLARFTENSISPLSALRVGAFYCLLLGIAATGEEIAFRGYPFQRLVEATSPGTAVAVSSAVFGLAHLGNPSWTWLSTFNTILVGIPLAVTYLRTRALWVPIGIHFVWNFSLVFVLGLPVSGNLFPGSLLSSQVHGDVLLTGGNYGPEGSLLATAAIVPVTLYLLFSKSIYTTEEMNKLLFGATSTRGDSPEGVPEA